MQGLTVANTKATVAGTDPAFDFTNLKNYLFTDSGKNTVAVLWFGNKPPAYDGAPRRSTATVSFPRTLSYNLANSYILETVTGKTISLQNFHANQVNDVFTIYNLPISQEPMAIVLQTGR
jgi:hypothetical protein